MDLWTRGPQVQQRWLILSMELVDTHPSVMGEDMELHLWELRANRGSLALKDPQHMSDATYTSFHRRQGPPAMEIQKLQYDSVQRMSHTTKHELL